MSSASPAVSVLLPARNAAATLAETLASLQAQTRQDFELVLVDDGSTDDTARLARALWPDDRLVLLQPGAVGLVAALQLGLAACRASWVARMDADDIAHPERLGAQLDLVAATPEVRLVGCLVEPFADGGVGEGYRLYCAWLNGLVEHDAMMRELYVESPLAHPSVLFHKETVLAVGGYRDAGWPEDYDLWLRLVRAGCRFAKVPRVLLHWRDYPGRTSRRDDRYSPAAFRRCKAHYLARGPLAGGRVVVWGGGPIGRRLARELESHDVMTVAFVDIDPRKVGVDRRGVPTVAPQGLSQLGSIPVLAAVGSRGARQRIREYLGGVGYVEGRDFWCAA